VDPSQGGGGGTAKFCAECGTGLTQVSRSAEYKQVTVLFADVVHSMDIAAAVGPERLREIMSEFAGPFYGRGDALRRNAEPVHGRRHHGGVRCTAVVTPKLIGLARTRACATFARIVC